MPQVYEGDRPYIFVNYAHADDAVVLPIIEALVAAGYRVWYDEGIELAMPFPEYIADHVYGCTCFIAFVSSASLASVWCRQEIYYAFRLQKTILPVYLENVELTRGLELSLGTMQATYWYRFRSDDAFLKALCGARALDVCLTGEGRRGRGVKPRSGEYGGRSYAAQKGSIADYSWTELKVLSQRIASAGDGDWLGIAKEYNLVDEGGKLWGDRKPFILGDGTSTSVRIAGFRHDDLVGGGKAGITFEFADVPTVHRMNPTATNSGGWESCEMRGWLNAEFLSLFPDDLRSLVEPVWKFTNNKGKVAPDDTLVSSRTNDKLWLLSANEIYDDLQGAYRIEGEQYQLYKSDGTAPNNRDFRRKRGTSLLWWRRSPDICDSVGFCLCFEDDIFVDWPRADNDWGVSPGFCF